MHMVVHEIGSRQGRNRVGLTGEVMSRTRASALNSSVVGVDLPVQTTDVPVYVGQRIQINHRQCTRTVDDVRLGLAELLGNLAVGHA